MKTIRTGGPAFLQAVPGGTADWYYGIDYPQGDLYEAEEIFKAGRPVKGRRLCLVHYPDGEVYVLLPGQEGHYGTEPVYWEGGVFTADVDFPEGVIRILRFDCAERTVRAEAGLPLASVKDCYNLRLDAAPLTLSRQSAGENEFEIVWPERIRLSMDSHDSFFLRDGERLFFSRWHEEGEGDGYRYWEETVVRGLDGAVLEVLPGDVCRMPDGQLWHIR